MRPSVRIFLACTEIASDVLNLSGTAYPNYRKADHFIRDLGKRFPSETMVLILYNCRDFDQIADILANGVHP